ncbi:hypothetical protein L6250_00260 [Candidatus Parcubacteria bacterium]|nr:hypothetical protein [Patescibacteria group bacterium]MCG2688067.1 hypothetical protein [Candidatus Parcubacteria bacterium]
MKSTQEIDKKIKDLAEKNLQRVGEWEIAQVAETVFSWQVKNGIRPVLNLVVHRESYFIFNTYLCFPEEVNSAAKTLIEAIEEHKIIPEASFSEKRGNYKRVRTNCLYSWV